MAGRVRRLESLAKEVIGKAVVNSTNKWTIDAEDDCMIAFVLKSPVGRPFEFQVGKFLFIYY